MYELMEGKGNVGNNINIALTGVGTLAKLIGIAVPPANAFAIIVDNIKDRRTKKHLDRLEKLIKCLDRRLTQLECKVPESPDLDLFDEIVAKAVSDEEEDKTELYAALVQYWLEHKPVPYEVRLLGNAIKELTVDEMEAFHGFFISKSPYPTKKMSKQLQEVFWSRVIFLGLLGGLGHTDLIHPNNVTQIGRKLVEIYQISITAK